MSNELEVEPKKKKVGYKNPPEHTQFKAGKSGNPSGRKKVKHQPKSFEEMLTTELTKIVNGKEISLTYEEYYYQKLYNRTMADDPRWGKAFDKIMLERYKNMLRRNELKEENAPIAPVRRIRINTVDARKKDVSLPASTDDNDDD